MWRRLRGLLRVVAILLAGVFVVKAAWFTAMRSDSAGAIEERRRYLVDRLALGDADGTAPDDDQFAGEWRLVTLSMTAAAVANMSFAAGRASDDDVRAIGQLVEIAEAAEVRAFDRDRWGEDPLASLDGPRGHVGYLGHYGLMLGAYRLAGGGPEHDRTFHALARAIERRTGAGVSPFLETYPGETYTADNAVAMAALALHDRAFGTDHRALFERWAAHVRARLRDPASGIMVSGVAPDGGPRGRGRGSFAAWSSFYLPFFHEGLAAEQWAAIERTLVVRLPLGLAALREDPKGVDAAGDVDSGPVLFGLSPSGTGFAVAGARRAGNHELARDLLDTAEVVGGTIEWDGRRRYLLAPLVGDAILLAMRTARPWDGRFRED